jgi:hypothetical protein
MVVHYRIGSLETVCKTGQEEAKYPILNLSDVSDRLNRRPMVTVKTVADRKNRFRCERRATFETGC